MKCASRFAMVILWVEVLAEVERSSAVNQIIPKESDRVQCRRVLLPIRQPGSGLGGGLTGVLGRSITRPAPQVTQISQIRSLT